VAAGLVLMLTGSLAACADGEAAEQISNGLDAVDAAPAAPAPGGTVADGQVFQQVSSQVCGVERRTIELAVEAFYAIEGRYPTTERELVDAQVLREEVTSYDVAPDGVITPAPGSTCT
jgi:hypothetical protein